MSQDQRRHIPSWLRRMRGWEETPDWLLDKIQEEQGGFSFLDLGITPESAGFGGDEVAARDKSDEPPQWERRDEPAQREKGGGSVTEIADELRAAYERERQGTSPLPTEQAGKTDATSAEQDEGASPSTRRSSGVTDWLVDLEEEASSEAESPPPSEMRESSSWAAEWQDVPTQTATTGTEDLPESDVEKGETPRGRSGVTDWLAHLDEEPLETEPPTSGPESPTSAAPAGRADLPDWLADLEATAPDAGAGGPDWLPDLQDEAESDDLYHDQETGTPAWLAELQGEGEGEDIPAWLAELDSGAGGGINEWLAEQERAAAEPPISTEEDEQAHPQETAGSLTEPREQVPPLEERAADTLTEREGDVGYAEMPDWLRDLDQVAGEQPPPAPEQAPGTVQPDAELTYDVDEPEESAADELVPDWLRELDQIAAEQPAVSEQVEGAPQEGQEDAYRASELESDVEEGIQEDQVPDWLRELDQIAGEQPPAPEQVPSVVQPDAEPAYDADELEGDLEESVAEGPLPDWLRELDQVAGEQPPSAPEQAPTVVQPDAAPTDDVGESEDELEEGTGDEPLPDWLRGLDQVAGEQPLAPEQALGTVQPDEEPTYDVDEPEGELQEDAGDEQVPDWLRDLAADEGEPEPGPLPEASAAQPDAQLDRGAEEEEGTDSEGVGDEEVPDWLRDLAIGAEEPEPGPLPEADTGAPDWLTFPEKPSPSNTEQEEAEPRVEPDQSPPAWMREIYTSQREAPADEGTLSLPSAEELGDEEAPDWLSSLQGGSARSPRQVRAAETSGPLAGLGGVLSPEPILAIHPKSTFQPIPPVPDAHQAEAELVVRTLETPASRRIRVSRSPGREILNSLGRWVIYGLLLATILIAPLRSLVQLPDFAETRAFYNAIEGLQPGDQVLLVFDYDASLDGTLTPQARAIIWHLQHRDLGIVLLSLTPQGTAIARDLIAEREGLAAGRDYIDLGYLPPHPASLLAFMENPVGGATEMGTTQDPVQTTLGRQVQAFSSLDMIITVSGDHEHIRWWIEQVQTKAPIELLAAVPAGLVPYIAPYYGDMGTGQVTGILGGLGPAAQYEELTGADFMPSARVSYVVQANALILFTGVVLVSGIGSLLTAQRRDAARKPLPSASGGN
jgi:hypothetical protein